MSMHKGIIGQADGGSSAKPDVTLKDYVERKCEVEDKQLLSSACEWPFPSSNITVGHKLTFNDWWRIQGFSTDTSAGIS